MELTAERPHKTHYHCRRHTIPAQRGSHAEPAVPNAYARPNPVVLRSSDHDTARSLAVYAPEWASLACTNTVDYIMDRDIRGEFDDVLCQLPPK